MNEERRPALAAMGLLALLVLAVYGQTLGFGFINLDDDVYVFQNPLVSGGLTAESALRAFAFNQDTYWHPLTWLSLQLDASLFGMNAGGFHLTNGLLHLASVLLFFHVLRRMTGRTWPSALAAALFAAHPLHVESVAWVTERKDVLAGFFWTLTMLAYLRYVERPGAGRYAAVAASLALGLSAKPMLATLPCALFLLDFWPLARTPWSACWTGSARPLPWSRLAAEKLPLMALCLGSVALSIVSHPPFPADDGQNLPIPLRLANAVVSYVQYLGKLAWPVDLSPHYPFPDQIPAWQVLAALALLAGLTALALRAVRRAPWLLVGWLWFLGVMVPVLKLYYLGQWYALADRFAYLPFLGLYTALAFSLDALVRERPAASRLATLPAGAAVLALALAAHVQAGYWKDSVTLFTRALEAAPGSHLIHNNLAVTLTQKKDPASVARAVEHAREAMRIKPYYAMAYANLGAALIDQGNVREAADILSGALERMPGSPQIHNNLGLALYRMNRPAEALPHLHRALALRPGWAEAHANAGLALAELGRTNEALAQFQEAVRLRPDLDAARNNLGLTLLDADRVDEALEQFRAALALSPDSARIRRNLARALVQGKRPREALPLLAEAMDREPEAETANELAGVLAMTGRWPEARMAFTRSLELDPSNPDTHVGLALVLLQTGNPAGAREHLLRAVGLKPDHASARGFLEHLNKQPAPGSGPNEAGGPPRSPAPSR